VTRERALKVVLVLVGLLFLAGVYPVTDSLWHANQSMYADDMMLSLYFALGIFLLMAMRNPSANRSLIAFTAWSSFAYGAVMTVMAFQKADERGGLLTGVAGLVVIGLALLVLAPPKPSMAGA
jgi:uncharacterized membrane protein HdeD (DUF308 family)